MNIPFMGILKYNYDNLKQQFNAKWNPKVNVVPFRKTKVLILL